MTLVWAIVLFGLLIFFHELGHFIIAKLVGVKVLKFSIGFGPKIVSKTVGETEYIISALPLGGYVKPLGEDAEDEIAEDERPRAFTFQPVWKRAAIVLAGPVFNLVLAFLIFLVFLGIKMPVAIPEIDSITTTIENVIDDSPALRAGLKNDDTIVSINGSSVSDWNEMAETFSKNPGRELTLEVQRGVDIIEIKVTPEAVQGKGPDGEDLTVGRIGISKKMAAKIIESSTIWDVPFKAAQAVYGWCVLTLEVIVKLCTGSLSADKMGGPIRIVDMASKAAEVGALTYFNFIAIISINLAILNLLPVPVLDGGHILFFLIEALRGKPLNDKVMGIANKVGLILLLLLITFVFYNDINEVVIPWIYEVFLPWLKKMLLLVKGL